MSTPTITALAEMSSATISDALFRMGHKNRTLRSRIKPVDPAMRVCGPAFTVHAYPGGTYATGKAIAEAAPGEVVVVDGGGYTEAVLWGEVMSWMAVAKGLAGAVIDGAVRDIDGVKESGFALFAAGITPAAGTGDKLGEVGIPIQCAGVAVQPGDQVFGDYMGVVIAHPQELDDVLDWCHKILDKEAELIARARQELKARLGA